MWWEGASSWARWARWGCCALRRRRRRRGAAMFARCGCCRGGPQIAAAAQRPNLPNTTTGEALPARRRPRVDRVPLQPPQREGQAARPAAVQLQRHGVPRFPAQRRVPPRRRVPLCARRLRVLAAPEPLPHPGDGGGVGGGGGGGGGGVRLMGLSICEAEGEEALSPLVPPPAHHSCHFHKPQQLCTDGAQCRRRVCFFAHDARELRRPEDDAAWQRQRLEDEAGAGVRKEGGALELTAREMRAGLSDAERSPSFSFPPSPPATHATKLHHGATHTQTRRSAAARRCWRSLGCHRARPRRRAWRRASRWEMSRGKQSAARGALQHGGLGPCIFQNAM